METKLKPFQQQGADFLASRYHALLADEPGLGKTAQALAAVETVMAKNVLVVAPASVCSQWFLEVEKFLGMAWAPRFSVVSYSSLHKVMDGGTRRVWDVCIADEVHYCKTLGSKRTQFVFGESPCGVMRRSLYKWGLTGTPVTNRPRELYPIMKALAGNRLGEYATPERFAMRYCGAFYDGYGLNDRGASNTKELGSRLDGFMLRRTARQVLEEIPEAVVTRIPLALSSRELKRLRELEDEINDREQFISSTFGRGDKGQLGDTVKLLKETGLAKVAAVSRFVTQQLETVGKVVVFAVHRQVVDELKNHLKEFNPVIFRGGMSVAAKQDAKLTFMTDRKCRVFIGNIRAAGTGVDGLQTVSNTAVFAEMSWVPGEIDQCVRRLKRMGAVANSMVRAFVLYAPGTLEGAVLGSHDRKIPVINELMGIGYGREQKTK